MTTGEGGILCTNNKSVYEHCKSFRTHGMIDRDTHSFLGFNYRMSEMNAIIGLEQLKKLDKVNKKELKILYIFYQSLKKIIKKILGFKFKSQLKIFIILTFGVL